MNKKNILGWIFGIALSVVGIGLLLYPVINWKENPDLTYMQIYIMYWKHLVGGIVVASIGSGLISYGKDV